jgi:hypothetical protein
MTPELSADAEAALVAALASNEQALLADLGQFGRDVSPRDAIAKGVRIFQGLSDQMQSDICTSPQIRQLVEEKADELTLATAIADLVATLSNHVPVATVAALIVKQGFSSYCSRYWT